MAARLAGVFTLSRLRGAPRSRRSKTTAGSERTKWARNLARDPRLGFGMQLDDRSAYGEAVVDVARGLERSVASKIARQYAAKYGPFDYRPSPD